MKKKPFKKSRICDEVFMDKKEETMEGKIHGDKGMDDLLKSTYAKEKNNLYLTKDFKNSLVSSMRNTAAEKDIPLGRKIHGFLNKEIEIPLVPLLAASLLLIVINVFPLNYEPRPEGRIIDVGGAQLWIFDNGEKEEVAYEN